MARRLSGAQRTRRRPGPTGPRSARGYEVIFYWLESHPEPPRGRYWVAYDRVTYDTLEWAMRAAENALRDGDRVFILPSK
jgi:hypothetical protein